MSKEPFKENIPVSNFVSRLMEVNHLTACGFDRFLFFPGMLFNAKEKWWGKGGLRAVSHEGLDLCFFAGADGAKFRMDETIQVPMVYDGVIVHVMDDFLGKTVITRHDLGKAFSDPILSLYGHTQPDPHIQIGDRIRQGDVFACLADISNRSKLLSSHLHISLAKARMLPSAGHLTWEMLNGADRSVFMDPLTILDAEYSIMDDGEDGGSVNFSELYSKYEKVSEKGGERGKPKTG
jgi:hypothetical protein